MKRAGRNLLVLLFFLSGSAGLMYEVLWSRMLSLVFGSSIFAVTAVLSAFMAGLALGSWVFGRLVSRSPYPLRIYAILEFGIGLTALLSPIAFGGIGELHATLIRNSFSPFYSLLVRFILAFLVLIVPTLLMGGTLPAISESFVKRKRETGSGISILYGMNTLGAVIGAGLVGLWLIGEIGISRTLFIAVALNFLIGFILIGFFWRGKKEPSKEIKPQGERRIKKKREISPSWILWGYAISGFISLAYEVVWTRILILYLFNGSYSFTIMLIAFLAGIGLGSLLIHRWVDSLRDPVRTFAILEVLIGISSLLVFLSFSKLGGFMLFLQTSLGSNWWTILGFALILSFVVMLLPTLLMGAIFPVVTRAYRELSGRSTSGSVGGIYASNTVGTVLGSLMAGFVLIPFIGALSTHLLLVALNLLLGAFFLWLTFETKKRPQLAFMTVLLLMFTFLGLNKARETKLHPLISPPGAPKPALIFYKEGPDATVTVFRYPGGQRSAYVNGNFIISDSYDALKTVKLLAHLPSVFLNGSYGKALVIGYGMGVTTSELLFYPFQEIQCVEIAPKVIDASYLFRDLNRDAYKDPRVRIYIEDGRNFLETSRDTYDLITVDPTHPVLGSGALYTLEFYKDCSEHLTEGGVMAQYLPLHLMSQKNFKSLLLTFSQVFPYTSLWLGQTHAIMVGGKDGLRLPLNRLKKILKEREIRESLNRVDLGSPLDFMAHFITDWVGVKEFVKGGIVNSDGRPFVEFIRPESVREDNWSLNMRRLLQVFRPPELVLDSKDGGEEFTRNLDAILAARKIAYRGMVLYGLNEKKKAVTLFERALQAYPEDPMIKRLLELARRRTSRSL